MDKRADVPNIDLMTLAGFCRDRLSRWYRQADAERGVTPGKAVARAAFCAMPRDAWKARHQTGAGAAKQAAFARAFAENAGETGQGRRAPQSGP